MKKPTRASKDPVLIITTAANVRAGRVNPLTVIVTTSERLRWLQAVMAEVNDPN